jgi:hypothetical protein
MTAKQTKAPPKRTWTAYEALSWGMFGDKAKLTLLPKSGITLAAPRRTYGAVQRDLRDAIAGGTVVARGFRVNNCQPPLARENLDSDLFDQFPSLAVDVCGDITFMHPASPQNIPTWRGIVFFKDEICALWPKPTPDLDQWMRHSVATGPDEKRDSRIGDCRKATGCTFKDATAAYDRLPQDMKRGRGQRITSPGSAK